jgi:prevent-host-death family protein
MNNVTARKAQSDLAALLKRVEDGERFFITKRGAPVAILTPVEQAKGKNARDVADKLRRFRQGKKLGKISLRTLIARGRS